MLSRSFSKIYTKTHEWVEPMKGVAKLGISSYWAHHIGDVSFLSIKKSKDSIFKKGEEIATLEAAKTVAPVVAPADLKIIKKNQRLDEDLKLINLSSEKNGYIVDVDIVGDIVDGMERSEYLKYLEDL